MYVTLLSEKRPSTSTGVTLLTNTEGYETLCVKENKMRKNKEYLEKKERDKIAKRKVEKSKRKL